MSKGNAGGTLGVGGTRSKLSRKALRGGRGRQSAFGDADPMARKRELLRRLREGHPDQR